METGMELDRFLQIKKPGLDWGSKGRAVQRYKTE